MFQGKTSRKFEQGAKQILSKKSGNTIAKLPIPEISGLWKLTWIQLEQIESICSSKTTEAW